MKAISRNGKIVTFYSFKGGVGRTMALANVALLAALNGKRVLVMDWDLEAPGVSYYFRGLLDNESRRAVESAPGLLDILYGWQRSLELATDENDLRALEKECETGSYFSESICTLVEANMASEILPEKACIHFIGAGAPLIEADDNRAYEEALANFSWNTFFEEHSGGYLLENLRNWAKAEYDYVLLDSRTGLADVAGICTMQLPDIVALCFVLNQQNVDGVAKVAAAIKAKRGESIGIRGVAMRVARRDSSEGSDAQARAITALTKIGGMTPARAQEDIETLSIAIEDSIPFYESLALFVATDPTLDPLTLSYARLAKELLGMQIVVPEMKSALVKLVRGRLQPKNATIDYLQNLVNGDDTRALSEIYRLVDSALDTLADGEELDEAYVNAISETAFELIIKSENLDDVLSLQEKLLDFLRVLFKTSPNTWAPVLSSAIEKVLDMSFFEHPDEELALLEEIDELMARTQTIQVYLHRMTYRRRLAKLLLIGKNAEAVMQTVGEIRTLIQQVQREAMSLSDNERITLGAAFADTYLLSGQTNSLKLNFEKAQKDFEVGLEIAESARITPEVPQMQLHVELAQLPNIPMRKAALHSIAAVKTNTKLPAPQFLPLAEIVQRPGEVELIRDFASVFFSNLDTQSRLVLISYMARQVQRVADFLVVVKKFIDALANDRKGMGLILDIAELTSRVLDNVLRRRKILGGKPSGAMANNLQELMLLMEKIGIPMVNFPAFIESAKVYRLTKPIEKPNVE